MNFAGYFDQKESTARKNTGERVKRGRANCKKQNNLLIHSNLKKRPLSGQNAANNGQIDQTNRRNYN
jgi:hypothetical protein